jgi:hypothetical protein
VKPAIELPTIVSILLSSIAETTAVCSLAASQSRKPAEIRQPGGLDERPGGQRSLRVPAQSPSATCVSFAPCVTPQRTEVIRMKPGPPHALGFAHSMITK